LLGIYALPIWRPFGGGLATTLLLYRIATSNGQTSVATMLLAGIALGSLAGAHDRTAGLHGQRPAAARPDLLGHGLACRRHMDEDRGGRPIILLSFAVVPFMARGLNASRSARPRPFIWAYPYSG
jgi:iron complex transport system permease protein